MYRISLALLAGTAHLLAAEFPALAPGQPDAADREHLRRSLTLLQSSTPTQRHNVRVLFYGQSITQQGWWKEVERHLRATYTNANLIVENRAIGGHSSQLLVKTAEADLYPFQPDLLIFHVYGSHLEYENIIRRARQRTCADILLQTDHLTRDEALTEPTDRSELSPKQWDAWMNHVFLPDIAAKYGACRADIRRGWKRYLEDHRLKAASLLSDSVHLNPHGEWLMAELLKPYLAPLPPKPGYDPMNERRVRTIPVPAGPVRIECDGTRIDLVFKPSAQGSVDVRINGRKPSEISALFGFTRVSSFPGSDWPILLKVNSSAPLVSEDWTVRIVESSADGKACRFSLEGSVTGPDGEGWSTNRFVSSSRRVTLEPEDWNLAYCVSVFKRPLPVPHTARWQSVLRGKDSPEAPVSLPGVEPAVTVAQGLEPGKHSLEIPARDATSLIQAVRIYHP